ncbi:hypothetical protein MHK_005122, partial [Candidatus Magnetomorum sp. HK-1]
TSFSEAAIRIRKDERWHARTYGMHYVDYFPHRELGIAYFLLGKEYQQNDNNAPAMSYNDKAQKELAVSLGLEGETFDKVKQKNSNNTYDTATSKTVYYLNEARGTYRGYRLSRRMAHSMA